MLIRPNKTIDNKHFQGEDTLETKDPFDHPIPGQSLTGDPQSWPWERPPEMTDTEDAFNFIVNKIENEDSVGDNLDKQMLAGVPIESITNTISFTGFTKGMWTADMAELLKVPVSSYLMLRANEKNIPFRMFNNPGVEEGLSDRDTVRGMKENNPKAFKHMKDKLMQEAQPKTTFLDAPTVIIEDDQDVDVAVMPSNTGGGMI